MGNATPFHNYFTTPLHSGPARVINWGMDKLNAYNERLRRAAAPRVQKVKKLRERGYTWAEIAAELGVSRQRAQQLGDRPA